MFERLIAFVVNSAHCTRNRTRVSTWYLLHVFLGAGPVLVWTRLAILKAYVDPGDESYEGYARVHHLRYLDERARSQGWEIHTTMTSLCRAAGTRLKSPALRHGGEQDVPLFIWHTAAFQSWYRALKRAGNRLDGAQLIAYVPLRPVRCFPSC